MIRTETGCAAGRCGLRRWSRTAAGLAVLLLCVREASAQGPADAAAARALFNEGRKLVEQGKFSDACPKFQESLRLKPGIGTGFNLADCWEKLGRTASAWGQFLEVASAARTSGQKERESVARARASALEAKLSYLVIESEETDPELRVTRDGLEVGRGAFGTAVPVDPGTHGVAAVSPTKKPWSINEDVKAGAKAKVTIPKLLPREAAPATISQPSPPDNTPVGTGTGGGAEGGPKREMLHTTPSSGLGVQRGVGLAVGGLGVVGLAAGAVFLVGYNSKNDDASALCSTGTCATAEIEKHATLIDDAKSQRTLSYVSFGVGGALLVAGTVLFFTAPSSQASSALRVEPVVGRAFQGLSLSGRF